MSRRRRTSFSGVLDPARMRTVLAGPYADTRTWIGLGRVGDLPEDRIFIPLYGWVLDVTIVSGPLTNEILPCRIPANTPGTIVPPTPGALVVVLFTDGDPNVQCTIVGTVTALDHPVPVNVNGQAIDEAYATVNHIVVDPTLGVDAQMGPQIRVSATTRAAILAPLVFLAEDTATQPFVKGTALKTAIDNFANALVAAGAYTSSAPVVASPTLVAAVTALATALTGALSTRIKGE